MCPSVGRFTPNGLICYSPFGEEEPSPFLTVALQRAEPEPQPQFSVLPPEESSCSLSLFFPGTHQVGLVSHCQRGVCGNLGAASQSRNSGFL